MCEKFLTLPLEQSENKYYLRLFYPPPSETVCFHEKETTGADLGGQERLFSHSMKVGILSEQKVAPYIQHWYIMT